MFHTEFNPGFFFWHVGRLWIEKYFHVILYAPKIRSVVDLFSKWVWSIQLRASYKMYYSWAAEHDTRGSGSFLLLTVTGKWQQNVPVIMWRPECLDTHVSYRAVNTLHLGYRNDAVDVCCVGNSGWCFQFWHGWIRMWQPYDWVRMWQPCGWILMWQPYGWVRMWQPYYWNRMWQPCGWIRMWQPYGWIRMWQPCDNPYVTDIWLNPNVTAMWLDHPPVSKGRN
jgi:hypothetical protein